jgi:hypothetical protein
MHPVSETQKLKMLIFKSIVTIYIHHMFQQQKIRWREGKICWGSNATDFYMGHAQF